jgi:hypothetical protein
MTMPQIEFKILKIAFSFDHQTATRSGPFCHYLIANITFQLRDMPCNIVEFYKPYNNDHWYWIHSNFSFEVEQWLYSLAELVRSPTKPLETMLQAGLAKLILQEEDEDGTGIVLSRPECEIFANS